MSNVASSFRKAFKSFGEVDPVDTFRLGAQFALFVILEHAATSIARIDMFNRMAALALVWFSYGGLFVYKLENKCAHNFQNMSLTLLIALLFTINAEFDDDKAPHLYKTNIGAAVVAWVTVAFHLYNCACKFMER